MVFSPHYIISPLFQFATLPIQSMNDIQHETAYVLGELVIFANSAGWQPARLHAL